MYYFWQERPTSILRVLTLEERKLIKHNTNETLKDNKNKNSLSLYEDHDWQTCFWGWTFWILSPNFQTWIPWKTCALCCAEIQTYANLYQPKRPWREKKKKLKTGKHFRKDQSFCKAYFKTSCSKSISCYMLTYSASLCLIFHSRLSP